MSAAPVLMAERLLCVKASKEGGATKTSDFRVDFKDYRGVPVRVLVRYSDAPLCLTEDLKFLRVNEVKCFAKFSHIRLPDGQHLHVANELLS